MNQLFYENRTLLSRGISLIYPRRCPVCDDIVSGGLLIHGKCLDHVQFVREAACENGNFSFTGTPSCRKCGKPLRDPGEEYCTDCMSVTHVFDRGFSVFRYRSISGSIYRFKYGGRQEYSDFFAAATILSLGETIRALAPDALIPVPLHRKRQLDRGYNQAEVYARAVGKLLDIPVCSNIVERTISTTPMKGLGITERRNNLKNAFHIRENGVKLNCVIIVDDIYTTGSTVDAVACELRGDGVKRIYCLTLAIGDTA